MDNKNSRPPVVAILGHVDHGKTSLLDKIRNTNLTAREAGGITQSIGAWQVKTQKGQTITFIDTPGHEAFGGMRSRGAKIADLAVLVIAADDGVMPQTKQSLQYIKESQTPFLVAVTKIDLQTAQIDKLKNQLLELEVVPEEYGGETVLVPLSSKTGEGIDNLLEMISLLAELHSVKGDENGELEAYVLEAQRDARRGVVFTVIVKNGSLKVGETVTIEGITGKIRGLFDQARKPVQKVGPGEPAEVLGFSVIPQVGGLVTHENKEIAQEKHEARSQVSGKSEGFPIILKADTSGSLEAVLGQLGTDVAVLTSGLGDIVEADVMTAGTTGATIVGFNVKVPKEVGRLAEEEKVKIYTYKIIYELLSDIERWIKESQEIAEKILGRALVIAAFPHSKTEKIAGCRVTEGRLVKTDKVRLVRGEAVLGNVRVETFKKGKLDADKADLGDECGIMFVPQFDFQVGDVLESYQA